MEIVAIQIICLCVLFVIMTFCGLLPVMLVMRNKNVRFSELTTTLISMCNCLAGGVFIGMCFLGLFPYVHEKFIEILSLMQIHTTFPVAEFVIVSGFFIILTFEQFFLERHSKTEVTKAVASDTVLAHLSDTIVTDSKKLEDEESYVCLLDSESQEIESSGGSDNKTSDRAVKTPRRDVFNEIKVSTHPVVPPTKHVQRNCTSKVAPKFGHSHHHMVLVGDQNTSGLRHLILLFAISVHSLFEGITLGLQTDRVKILHLFLAVLIHETLVAFALGVNIAKLNFGFCKSLKCVLMVTGSIPIGILMGLLIGTAPGLLGGIVSGVLQGIAAGIFIHVTFMELLPEEFSTDKNRLLKVFFFFVGFIIMAVVNFALGDHK